MWRYFYVDGKLHRLRKVNYGRDEALAWCFSEQVNKIYAWSDIRRRGSRGFTTPEACAILHRTKDTLYKYIKQGLLDPPEMAVYPNQSKRIYSEEDLFKLQEIIASQHLGRPRADGMIVSYSNAPTKEEVYAAVKHDMVLYTKNDEGEFIPLYRAEY